MIAGIGIDIIEIERFKDWPSKPYAKLHRIFSHEEIAYALSNPLKAPERFAVRFAAREALYKACSSIICPIPFLTLCKEVSIFGTPARLKCPFLEGYEVHLSLSHNRSHAIAQVIVEKL